MSQFNSACAAGNELTVIIDACVSQLGAVPGHQLGFVYINDPLADRFDEIVDVLKEKTGIDQWFGTMSESESVAPVSSISHYRRCRFSPVTSPMTIYVPFRR